MLKGLLLIDTSIMQEILNFPKSTTSIKERFNSMLFSNDYILFLPLATIFETGNHISQLKREYNNARFEIAQDFISKVQMALDGTTPFRALEWEAKEIGDWINSFPEEASKGKSFGDCSIIAQFKKLCQDSPTQLPIKIWSKDSHLQNYKRNWNFPEWKDI